MEERNDNGPICHRNDRFLCVPVRPSFSFGTAGAVVAGLATALVCVALSVLYRSNYRTTYHLTISSLLGMGCGVTVTGPIILSSILLYDHGGGKSAISNVIGGLNGLILGLIAGQSAIDFAKLREFSGRK